jgi:hypothetical protein
VHLIAASVEEDRHVVRDRCFVDGGHPRFVGGEGLVLGVQLYSAQTERSHPRYLGGRVLEIRVYCPEWDNALAAERRPSR